MKEGQVPPKCDWAACQNEITGYDADGQWCDTHRPDTSGRVLTQQQIVAEVLLRQYGSEYQADHLSWLDFIDEANEILTALDKGDPDA